MELLTRVIDLLNMGKARQANELLRNTGKLGESVEELLNIHRMYCGLPLVPIEQMEKNFARIRREYARRAFERAVKGDIEPGQIKLDLERRTDFLILLLHYSGEVWGRIKLAKLLLMFWNQSNSLKGSGTFYNKYAYDFGAFERDIPQDLKTLRKMGLVEKQHRPQSKDRRIQSLLIRYIDGVYKLTPKGEAVAKDLIRSAEKECPDVIKDIQKFIKDYGPMSGKDLYNYTSWIYPDYAKKSKIKRENL